MKLGSLKPAKGGRKRRKRVSTGPGSGHGKTCGRGTKGEGARSSGPKPGFEGGQMPLIRRVPKRGFKNIFKKEHEIINVEDLAIFEANSEVGPEIFRERGLVRKETVKILGRGELKKALVVRAHSFSSKARSMIESAGGKAIEVDRKQKPEGGKQK